MEPASSILGELQRLGYAARIIPAGHIADLRDELQGRLWRGEFDPGFYAERLTHFDFSVPSALPGARSLIVIAAPRPRTRLRFRWHGRERAAIVPPTYVGYVAVRKQIEAELADLLAGRGYALRGCVLPLKLLATHAGLAQYGRNNVTYVAGMGSFHELVAAYSDLPPAEDTWQAASPLPACEQCTVCGDSCPTGAICGDRFLLHAERCLTFHNEKPGDVPFPAWIKPSWHNCLVGCMVCQNVCPENRGRVAWTDEGAEFSEDETARLLGGAAPDQLGQETLRKLEQMELLASLDTLPRNLGVLLKRSQQ